MSAILMIPGFTGSKNLWGKTASFFEESNFQCYPVTLPLRSIITKKSNPALGRISTEDDLNFLREEAKKIKNQLRPDEQFIGMGHSRGALLALMLQQEFTQKGQKLFDKIVLITPAAPAGIKLFNRDIVKSLISLRPIFPFGILFNRPVKRSFEETVHAVLDENMSDQELLDIYNSLCWESGKVVKELLFTKPKINFRNIKTPVLVIGGTADKMVPLETAQEIARMFRATFRQVNGPHLLLKGQARKRMCEKILNWIWGL